MLAAFAMSLELIVSGTTPTEVVLTAMLGTHALIGIGEALITVAALGFITVVRPDLFKLRRSPRWRWPRRSRRPRPMPACVRSSNDGLAQGGMR